MVLSNQLTPNGTARTEGSSFRRSPEESAVVPRLFLQKRLNLLAGEQQFPDSVCLLQVSSSAFLELVRADPNATCFFPGGTSWRIFQRRGKFRGNPVLPSCVVPGVPRN